MLTRADVGQWIFRRRSWLPVPFALALVLLPAGMARGRSWIAAGTLLVVAGQAVRLWAVRHIGVISRTRSARLGPLIRSGPYAWVRNPLYVGNLLLWTGFVLWSRLIWMLPVAWLLFALQYGAIASFEAGLLRERYGDGYDAYAREVRAWVPVRRTPGTRRTLEGATNPSIDNRGDAARHPWGDVLFSERGTLIAVAVMSLLLIAKARLT